MKILITGGNGYIAKSIYSSLSSKYDITTVTRQDFDLTCWASTYKFFYNKTFDVVIHTAGKAHYLPKTSSEEKSFFIINVEGTRYLLESLECSGIPKEFVFISSVSV